MDKVDKVDKVDNPDKTRIHWAATYGTCSAANPAELVHLEPWATLALLRLRLEPPVLWAHSISE